MCILVNTVFRSTRCVYTCEHCVQVNKVCVYLSILCSGQQGEKSNARKLLTWIQRWHKNRAAGVKPTGQSVLCSVHSNHGQFYAPTLPLKVLNKTDVIKHGIMCPEIKIASNLTNSCQLMYPSTLVQT